MLLCRYCYQEKKNNNSLINHERCCPQNVNRVYKNGMTGKKGSNQYIKADKYGLPKPTVTSITRKKLSTIASQHNKNRSNEIKIKISQSMILAHKDGRAGKLNPIKKYLKNNKPCRLYIIIINDDTLSDACIKIGITEKSIKTRFANKITNYEILVDYYNQDGLSIALLERELHKKFYDYRIHVGEFAGKTECFNIEILDAILALNFLQEISLIENNKLKMIDIYKEV